MLTTYATDALLNHVFRNTTMSSPTTVYAGLLTAVTDDEAGTVTEASYAGYARKAITFAAPGAGLGGRFVQNSGAVTFDAKSDAGTVDVIAVGIYDALTSGNLLGIAFLDGGDPIVFLVDATGVTNNTLTAGAHGLANDQRVRLQRIPGAGAIPTGLAENTTYFVVGTATDTVQLAATQGGAAIDITDKGGALVMKVTPLTLAQNDQANFAINALKVYLD